MQRPLTISCADDPLTGAPEFNDDVRIVDRMFRLRRHA